MKRLIIKSLSILSKNKDKGNIFNFIDGLNFIKSRKNSAGKTTLLNLIYSALGCKVKFKKEWEDVYVRLDISVHDKEFSLYKTPNQIFYISIDSKVKKYESESEFHSTLQKLLGYNIYLKTHESKLKIARPAHFLSTSYISQTNGWNSFFSPSFEGLGEFNGYKASLVEQFTTLKNCSEIRNTIELDEIKDELRKKIVKHDVLSLTIKNLVFNKNQSEIQGRVEIPSSLNDIQTLSEKYEQEMGRLQEKLSALVVEKSFLVNEINFSTYASEEIEQDYLQARKNAPIIECPYCGTLHSNTISEKSELFSLKTKLEIDITKKQEVIEKINAKIDTIKNEISNLSELKGKIANKISHNTDLLKKSIAASEISNLINELSKRIDNLNANIKSIKNAIRDTRKQHKNHAKSVNQFFAAELKKYAHNLSLTFNTYDKIKKVTNYNNILKQVEGGDADSNRSVLAYYLAIYQTAMNFETPALPPLVIDTPNQNDQDPENYHAIIETLLKEQEKQIIVCLVSDDSKKDNWDNINQIEIDRLLKDDKVNRTLFDSILLCDL